MARRQVYPLGKNGPRELSPGEIHAILLKRFKNGRERLEKKGIVKKIKSNLDE